MTNIIILFIMIFLHLIDDYKIQGLLATFKQKENWKDYNEKYNNKYKNDWLCALIEHAFSWSFMIMLPITIMILLDKVAIGVAIYVIAFIVNLIIHAVVDDLKANRFKINLCQDQAIHIVQIIITWLCLIVI